MLLIKSWNFAAVVLHTPFSSMPHGVLSPANFDQYLKLSAQCSLRYITWLLRNLLRCLGMWCWTHFSVPVLKAVHPNYFVSNMLLSSELLLILPIFRTVVCFQDMVFVPSQPFSWWMRLQWFVTGVQKIWSLWLISIKTPLVPSLFLLFL